MTKTNNTEVLAVLRELVEALDKTHWSSWQTTASFDGQLQRAREAIKKIDGCSDNQAGWL